jgi:hypothetical protein
VLAAESDILQDGFFDQEYNHSAIEISHPIVQDNLFLGVWTIRVLTDSFYNVLEDRSNLGETGESILINNEGKLLSPRRFDGRILTNIKTPDANECKIDFANRLEASPANVSISQHDSPLLKFKNEFGREILGAHAEVQGPVKGVKWCVLVEMSQKEALNSLDSELMKAAISSLVVLICLMIVFIVVYDFCFRKLLK